MHRLPDISNERPAIAASETQRSLPITQALIVFSFIGGKNCTYRNYVMTKLAVRP